MLDEEDPGAPNIPDYWKIISQYTIGTLKTEISKLFQEDPTTEKFQKWLKQNGQVILNSYIQGLTTGNRLAAKTCINDFAMWVYVIEQQKPAKDIQNYKPEKIKPKESELEKLYNKDKIKKEIDDLLDGIC